MQIKTISYKRIAEGVEAFDAEVNQALAEGWQLVRREPLPGYDLGEGRYYAPTLYAELVKLDPPPEPDRINLMAAASAIQLECYNHESCRECPLDDVCGFTPPQDWQLPGEEAQA